MAKFNFEGDIDNISEPQLEFINKVILEHGFTNSKITFEPVGKVGDNYVASVKRITVEGEKGSLKIIAKIAPTHEIQRQIMNTWLMFKNEHAMYTDFLPKILQLQKEADIPEEDQLRYPKCYGSFTEAPYEVILLEDLKTSDFTMLDRFESLSNDCVKSVLKNFAILHSLSYVLKNKEPETFDKFKVNLLDMWSIMAGIEDTKIFFQGIEDEVLSVLEDPEHVNLLRHKIADTINLTAKLAKVEFDNKYSVIVQGDSWTNNIMFKFEDDKLAGSVMIDYQLSKNSSPVFDLLYMIFNCTDYESRKRHYHDWIDYYHSELEKSLSNFDLKVNFIYPRDRLDADLMRYGKVMFGLSMCLATVLIRNSEDAAKMVESMKSENMLEQMQGLTISQLDEESRTRFKNRIEGVLKSFIDFGLF